MRLVSTCPTRRNQRQSIRVHDRSSSAIRSNQRHSESIIGHQRPITSVPDERSDQRDIFPSRLRGASFSPAAGWVACRGATSQGRASATWPEIAPRPSTPREAHAPDEGRNQTSSEVMSEIAPRPSALREAHAPDEGRNQTRSEARMHSRGAHALERRACIHAYRGQRLGEVHGAVRAVVRTAVRRSELLVEIVALA